MITYNQERYIAQALESVLMQRTRFQFELVIGEDCSTDGTAAIVREYHKRYPDIVRPLLAERNLGMLSNAARTLMACRGEYVATIEGDDYWTCPDKLQTQADLLDAHPDVHICGHAVEFHYQDQQRPPLVFPGRPTAFYGIEDLIRENFLPTSSVVFRNRACEQLPDWFFQLKLGDWPLHLLHARSGKIGFIQQPMGVYRIHGGGVWSTRGELFAMREKIRLFECLDAHFDRRYRPVIRETLCEMLYWLSREYVVAGDFGKARECFLRCLAVSRPMAHLGWKARLAFPALLPWLYSTLRAVKRRIRPAHRGPV